MISNIDGIDKADTIVIDSIAEDGEIIGGMVVVGVLTYLEFFQCGQVAVDKDVHLVVLTQCLEGGIVGL